MGDRVTAGIGLGILAYSLFAVHDAANKWLVATVPVWQVLFFRSITIVLGCIILGRGKVLTRIVETPLKAPLALRSAITLLAWLCYYFAARSMPLAQLMTLYFSSPIITTMLAIPLLGERVTAARWASLAIGFTGVLVASDPFGVRATLATGLVLFASVLWGYGIILMRQIARREPSMVQMLYQNICNLVVTGTLCLFTWKSPDTLELTLLLTIGVLGGLGQYSLFEGCRLAPASVMATVEYTALLWAFVLGYIIWHDFPSVSVFAGAGLIFASGILLVVSERRRR